MGKNYVLEVPIPIKYKTLSEAKGNNSSLRFEKKDEHIVLVVYSNWEQGLIDGRWHEQVTGKILDVINWENGYKYKMLVEKDSNISDHVPCATNWDELFNVHSLEDNWCLTVSSLAYRVIGIVD